ncbi:MAG: ATP-binding protein [Deltaproteobacteria bacterium]|nr:ATP-binding protein [Deltaproteobacteria bacterium]
MQDLSLHILDIVENATKAGATLIEIAILEDINKDLLQITIKDNGRGMDAEMLEGATDPFVTTRTTRRVGLGLPLLEQAAKETGGNLLITSDPGKGTKVVATFQESHIDRRPVGDMGATLTILIMGNPDLDFIYFSNLDGQEIEVDTRSIRGELNGSVSINDPAVIRLIKNLFKNNMEN